MTDTLAFTVPGNPVPKERARTVRTKRGKARSFTPTRTVTYEGLVAASAIGARIGYQAKHGAPWPTDARYAVTLVVARSSHRACDLSNILKAVEDGAQSKFKTVARRKVRTCPVLWDDDSQIDELRVVRGAVSRNQPHVLVTVTRLGVDPVRSKAASKASGGRRVVRATESVRKGPRSPGTGP